MGKQVDAQNERPSYLVSTREQVTGMFTRWKEQVKKPVIMGFLGKSRFLDFLRFRSTLQPQTQPENPIFGHLALISIHAFYKHDQSVFFQTTSAPLHSNAFRTISLPLSNPGLFYSYFLNVLTTFCPIRKKQKGT